MTKTLPYWAFAPIATVGESRIATWRRARDISSVNHARRGHCLTFLRPALIIFALIIWLCIPGHPTSFYNHRRRPTQAAVADPLEELEMQSRAGDDTASTRTVVAPIPPLYKKDPASHERLPPAYTTPTVTPPTPALLMQTLR